VAGRQLLFRAKIGVAVATILFFGLVYWLVGMQAPRHHESKILRRDVLQALSTKVEVISGASMSSSDVDAVARDGGA
jgi:hypothetical protein